MATGVNVKMGVTGVSEFKRGMKDAEGAVKSLDEQLKLNEAQLKLNGNQELYMKNKVELLKEQINKQAEAVRKANEALQAMKNNGVDQTSASFQAMQTKVYAATTKLTNMRTELKNVETGSGTANTALENIGKNVAWDNVAEGLGKITDKLESAGRAAIRLGQRIMSSVKGSTGWADDLITLSEQTDVDVITLQKIDKVAHILETDAEAIAQAKQRMAKATQSDKGVESIEEVLGVKLTGQSADDLFWEIGEALVSMGEGFDKETAAQKVFGRSWHELLPLFKLGREEYEKLLEDQTYLSEEDVRKLGKADDAIKSIEKEWEQMKNQFWADNADKITEMMTWLIDNKELVVGALTAIGGAFGAMKMAEFAANLMKVKDGFGALGLFGGGKAAAGGAEAAAAAGGGIKSNISGILNKVALVSAAGAMYEATEGKIRDVFKNFQTATAGMSSEDASIAALMHDLGITEEQARSMVQSPGTGSSNGKSFGADWRPSYMQDQSYYGGPGKGSETVQTGAHGRGVSTFDNYSASMDRMASAAAETSANTQRIAQNSVTSADIQTLTGLPAAVAQAVTAGMKTVTIVIGASAVDAIGTRVGGNMANQVLALTK